VFDRHRQYGNVWRWETKEKGKNAYVLGLGLFVTFQSETALGKKTYCDI
jgi:hypothetical protein